MASEAVQLLTAINNSIQSLSASMATLKPQGQAPEDAVEMLQRRNRERVQRETEKYERTHLSQLKTSIFESARELKSRRELDKAVKLNIETLNKIAKGEATQLQKMRAMQRAFDGLSYMIDDLSDKKLKALAERFQGMEGPMRGISDRMKEGGASLREFLESQAEAAESTAKLSRMLEEARDAVSRGIKLDDVKRRAIAEAIEDERRARQAAGIAADDSLIEFSKALDNVAIDADNLTGALGNAADTLKKTEKERSAQMTQAMGVFTTAAGSAATDMQKASHGFRLSGSGVGGAVAGGIGTAVGVGALMGRDDDGSSVVGDAMSGINTNVDSGWLKTTIAGIMSGMGPKALREMYAEAGAGHGQTATQVGGELEKSNPSFDLINSLGGVTKYEEAFRNAARIVDQLGGSVADVTHLTRDIAVYGDRMQTDMIATRTQSTEFITSMMEGADTFALLYAAGNRTKSSMALAAAKTEAFGAKLGFTTTQMQKFAERAGSLAGGSQDTLKAEMRDTLIRGQMLGVDPEIQQERLRKLQSRTIDEKDEANWAKLLGQKAAKLIAADPYAKGVLEAKTVLGNNGFNYQEAAKVGVQADANVAAQTPEMKKAIDAILAATDSNAKIFTDVNTNLSKVDKSLAAFVAFMTGAGQNAIVGAMVTGITGAITLALSALGWKTVTFAGKKLLGLFGKKGVTSVAERVATQAATQTATRTVAQTAANATTRTAAGLTLETAEQAAARVAGVGAASRFSMVPKSFNPLKLLKGGVTGLGTGIVLDYLDDKVGATKYAEEKMGKGGGYLTAAMKGGLAGAAGGAFFGGAGAIPGAAIGAVGGLIVQGISDLMDDDTTTEGEPDKAQQAATRSASTLIDVHDAIVETGMQSVSELQKLNKGMEVLIGMTATSLTSSKGGRITSEGLSRYRTGVSTVGSYMVG